MTLKYLPSCQLAILPSDIINKCKAEYSKLINFSALIYFIYIRYRKQGFIMVNFNNYSSRYTPSVNTGRTNIWNRYEDNANNKRMAFIEQTSQPMQSSFGAMPPILNFGTPMQYINFGAPPRPMGGFTQVNIQNGPSESWMQGNATGQITGFGINLYQQFQPQITNFFHKIFG